MHMFSCSDHNFIIKSSQNKYLFYLLSGNLYLLGEGFNGSVLKNLSKTYLNDLKIPIPQSGQKITEWVEKISRTDDEKLLKEARFTEIEAQVQQRIQEITEHEECEEVEIR